MRTLGTSPYEQAEEAMGMSASWFNSFTTFCFKTAFLVLRLAIKLAIFILKLPHKIYVWYINRKFRRKNPEMFQGFEPVIPVVPPLED